MNPSITKVSIITVVYNGASHLEQTIKSILEQDYSSIEYIIIDGGSTDGSVDIIKQYEDRIFYWCSEPDAGIYSAMNKGLAKATGELVGIQNSDDWYEPGVFGCIAEEYAKHPNAILYGLQRLHDDQGEREIRSYPHQRLAERNITHSTVFIPRNVYERFGLFDESFRITADYDLMLRLYRGGVEFRFIDSIISNFRRGGISSSQVVQTRIESNKALLKNELISKREYNNRTRKLKIKNFLGMR